MHELLLKYVGWSCMLKVHTRTCGVKACREDVWSSMLRVHTYTPNNGYSVSLMSCTIVYKEVHNHA